MRDKLIRLLSDANEECKHSKSCENCSGHNKGSMCMDYHDADYLLANGVIVPPVKIGQELWDIHRNKPRRWEAIYLGYNGKEWHIHVYWWRDIHNFKTLSVAYPFIDGKWYLSKEEAESTLKGGSER